MKHVRIFIVVLLVSLVYLLSGCEILKNKRRKEASETQVNRSTETRVDSSATTKVSTETIDAKTVWDWWKTTVQYAQPVRGDSSVVNNYLTTPQPQVIIMEGGKGQRDETTQRTDSTFFLQIMHFVSEKVDSVKYMMQEMEKKKESQTKGVGLLTLCLIGGGFLGLNRLLEFVASRYKITRKTESEAPRQKVGF